MTAKKEKIVHPGEHHPDSPIPLRQKSARILQGTASYKDRFIQDHKELGEILCDLRSQGSIIGFATGVWDLFHIGHGDYLQKGREAIKEIYPDAECIIMVVGVDTDSLTKKRKGPQRPIVSEDERCRILSHLRSVDIITLQYELNQLYPIVTPHVQIVSTSTKDLPLGMDVVKACCEHLVSLPPQAETSTSARIRRLAIDGKLETINSLSKKLTNILEEVRNELG